MKKIILSFSLLVILLSGCSKPSAPPPPASPAPVKSAGEGVTWDSIGPSSQGGSTAPGAENRPGGPTMLGGNTPPQIQAANFVAGSGNGESISVNAATVDADGDPVTIEYAWTVNGKPAGNESRLQAGIRRGDFVTVTLTPFDGKVRGRSVTLRSQVNNSPPVIAGIVDVRYSDDSYTARIQASDPDGDPLRYGLVSGPAGMEVDPVEGTLKWTMPRDFKGKVVFMVSARDRSGAQSTHAATISVSEKFE